MSDRKVFIFGLDGAAFEYLLPLVARGRLLALSGMIKKGVYGDLRTSIPPITGSAWPSFMTGKNPARHGVFDFIQQELKKEVSLVNSRSIDGETIFDILSRHGRRIISINVPVTYPPWKINGIMVTGMLSPENSEFTYPPELKNELPGYRIDLKTSYKEGKEQELIDDLLDLLQGRLTIAKRFLSQEQWDFGMVVFRGTDIMPHYFRRYMDKGHPSYRTSDPHYRDAISRIYEETDHAMQEIMEIIPEDTIIMVMSDHGHGRLRKMINLNIWFRDNGFLTLKKDPSVSLKYNLFKLGVSPQNVYSVLSRFGIQNIIQRFSRQTRNKILNSMLSFNDVDWSKTRAYSLGHIGQIYVNLEGREPFGIVKRGAEYEGVRTEIVKKLKLLRDPDTGHPVIDRVVRKEEIYEGPYLDKAPDLLVFTRKEEYDCFALMAQNTDIFCDHFKKQSGNHRLDGIFLGIGPGIRGGQKIANAEIIDVTPTILYAMDIPIPDDMDGKVLEQIFEPSFLASHAIAKEKARQTDKRTETSEGDEEEIKMRLRQLGYLG